MTNSEGCRLDRPGTEIQRRAPLISMPMTKVAASSTMLPQNTSSASRRMWRGEASEIASISTSAIGRKKNWRLAKMKESAPMRSAAGGEAASVSMTPKAMMARMAPSDQRSTVHHHWPITLRSSRGTWITLLSPKPAAPGRARAMARNASPRCS